MATQPINNNTMDLAQFRGPVRKCPFCLPDQIALRSACSKCFGQGFIAHCLNCDGTGQFKGASVWDGGRSSHTSTCTPCGGLGFFPHRGPATKVKASPLALKPIPRTAKPPAPGTAEMPNDAPDGTHVVETVASSVT